MCIRDSVILGYMMLHTSLLLVILLHNLLLMYHNMLSSYLVSITMLLRVHYHSNLKYYFLFELPNLDLISYMLLNLFHLVYMLLNLYRLLSSLLLDILYFYLRIFLLYLYRIFLSLIHI